MERRPHLFTVQQGWLLKQIRLQDIDIQLKNLLVQSTSKEKFLQITLPQLSSFTTNNKDGVCYDTVELAIILDDKNKTLEKKFFVFIMSAQL